MTSAPASRSAIATTLTPRSWPSSPGFASTTLMRLPIRLASQPPASPAPPSCCSVPGPGEREGGEAGVDLGGLDDVGHAQMLVRAVHRLAAGPEDDRRHLRAEAGRVTQPARHLEHRLSRPPGRPG